MPFLLGWLRLWGEHASLDSTEFGTATFAAANIALFTTLVILCARPLNHLELKRLETAASLRRADEALQQRARKAEESERRFRFLADRVPQIIWTAKPDGYLDYCNQRWLDYAGITLEESLDSGWKAFVHPDDLKDCNDRWMRSLTTGCDYEVEFRLRRSDRLYRWHLGRAFPMRDELGQIIQWVGASTDIEDQKRSRNELAQLVAERTVELSRANAALEERQQFLEVLVNNLEVGVLFIDL